VPWCWTSRKSAHGPGRFVDHEGGAKIPSVAAVSSGPDESATGDPRKCGLPHPMGHLPGVEERRSIPSAGFRAPRSKDDPLPQHVEGFPTARSPSLTNGAVAVRGPGPPSTYTFGTRVSGAPALESGWAATAGTSPRAGAEPRQLEERTNGSCSTRFVFQVNSSNRSRPAARPRNVVTRAKPSNFRLGRSVLTVGVVSAARRKGRSRGVPGRAAWVQEGRPRGCWGHGGGHDASGPAAVIDEGSGPE